MLLNGKAIGDITEADLRALVDVGAPETDRLDFKRELPEANDNSKFPALVSAFANANGGHIIYGMEEKEGIASELIGLTSNMIGKTEAVTHLQNLANSGIEPRIPGLRIREIKLSQEGRWAIVVYVPRSIAAPHQITNGRKFYRRYAKGNAEMNVEELRRAFGLSEAFTERTHSFRRQRVTSLAQLAMSEGTVPVRINNGITLVVHMLPLDFSESQIAVDLSRFDPQRQGGSANVRLLKYSDSGRYNAYGFVRPNGYEPNPNVGLDGYTQIFRNGAVEIVQILPESVLPPSNYTQGGFNEKFLNLFRADSYILDYVEDAQELSVNLDVEFPLVVMVSVLKVGDKKLSFRAEGIEPNRFEWQRPQHKPQDLLLPDLVLQELPASVPQSIRPILDVLWQAGGIEKSLSFDPQGNWIDRKF